MVAALNMTVDWLKFNNLAHFSTYYRGIGRAREGKGKGKRREREREREFLPSLPARLTIFFIKGIKNG